MRFQLSYDVNFVKFFRTFFSEAISATLLMKMHWHRCISFNFAKFLRTQFLQRTSGEYFSFLHSTYRWMVLSFLKRLKDYCIFHCVKSIGIRRFSGPYFPAFGLNTERSEVSPRIQSKCGKKTDLKNTEYGHFSRSVLTFDITKEKQPFEGRLHIWSS